MADLRRLFSRVSRKRIPLTVGLLLFPKLPSTACFCSLCKNKHVMFSLPAGPPPVAKKLPLISTDHGVNREDPYRWMSDVNDPDFLSYINQENSYAVAFMRDTDETRRMLYSEMVSRMPSNISTPPERWGPWLYYQCIPEGKEYPILCRRLAVESESWFNSMINSFKLGFGREQVLLDWNEIAEKHGYVHVGVCRISPDHSYLAYTLDTTGNEQFQLQIKDLQNNSVLPQFRVEGVVSLAWAQDSRTLFYTLCDINQRPHRVLCTKVGSQSLDDVIILTENDSRFCLDITSTKDGKFVTVNSNSRTSSEVFVINSTTPLAGLQRFCKRVSGVQYFLEHHGDFFYVLTNAPRSKDEEFHGNGYYLSRCQDKDVSSSHLQHVFVPGEDTCLEDMDIFEGHLVLFLNKNGFRSIFSIDMPIDVNTTKQMQINDLNPWFFPLPSNMCSVAPGSNHDFLNTVYRVVLSSPLMPDLLVDYDMSKRIFSIVQQEDVKNFLTPYVECQSEKSANDINKIVDSPCNKVNVAWDTKNHGWKDFSRRYACEETEVISHDGLRIPLTILFSRSAYQEGQSPGLLHGYGAYGEGLDKSWSADRLSLLDRGWLFAFADVRGGAGASPCWHKSGCRLNKLNSIHDFISCGEYLINKGFVHKDQLNALGISAGCLLVGAAINMHSELFCGAILKVPFLDILNTLLDPSLPLTTLDYEEFGNPQTKSIFDYINKYSPYDNLPRGVCCPSVLVSASFNDSRVGVWEAAKWVARLRDTACAICSSAVILQTNMNGGHFREGGRCAHCLETAYDYAFLMKVTGRLGDGTTSNELQ